MKRPLTLDEIKIVKTIRDDAYMDNRIKEATDEQLLEAIKECIRNRRVSRRAD